MNVSFAHFKRELGANFTPSQLWDESVEWVLQANRPGSDEHWEALIRYWTLNLRPSSAKRVIGTMAQWAGCPLPSSHVVDVAAEALVEFMLHIPCEGEA